MKKYWIAVVVGTLFTISAAAQAGASGSASTQTSVSAGQTGAGANANQNTQASGSTSAGTRGSASSSTEFGAGANGPGASLDAGSIVQAELTKSLDAKKAKAGDSITAQVTQDVKSNGQVVIRRGSKLVGHVTEAQARSKENNESRLGVLFDKAVLKGGSEVALNAVVQALAPAQRAAVPAMNDDNERMPAPAPMGGGAAPSGPLGGAVSGAASTVGAVGNTVGSTTGAVTGAAGGTVGGALSSTSRGVIGMQGLTLSSAAAGNANAQGSVISSTTQNVRLDSGTQMVLQVNGSNHQ